MNEHPPEPPHLPGSPRPGSSGHTIGADWGGMIGWFVHNHVAANILMLLFVVGGLISVATMRTETFPSVDPRMVSVSVSYPGATPYEVAEGITSRVEEALTGINGVKRITGTATEGYGVVTVELEDFADADDVYNDVETAVNGLSDFPPADAERPIVNKAKVTPTVLRIALYGDVPEETLAYWTETLDEELRQLPEVSLTSTSGVRDYQISVEVSEDTLRHYNLSLSDISTAIQAFSIDIPAGTIEARQGDILLRIQQKRYDAEAFSRIALRTLEDGSTLYLGDVASVVDGFDDVNLISEFNGQRAAFITINRSETEDTLRVAGAAKDYLETVALPEGLQVGLQRDRTFVLKERISLMLRNAVLGFMMVFIILLLFLDLKLAFWTSAAIPVSFLGGLMLINLMGYSINMVSLFALIVVLGIVVDDAIVTGESIFDAQEKYDDNPHAVMHGVKRVVAPVTVGVTTTIAAFAPLIFSSGTFGQIIKVIPIAVIPILAISLLEAFFILPSHLEKPNRWSRGIIADIRTRISAGLFYGIDRYITPLAAFSIKWRYVTLAIFIGWGIITAGLFSSGTVRFIFFPRIESDRVNISVTMPRGTPFEMTRDAMTQVNNAVQSVRADLRAEAGYDLFESTSLSVGERSSDSNPSESGGRNSGAHLGQVRIRLVSSDLRTHSSSAIESMIRERIGDLPNVEELSLESSLMGDDADIEVELTHPDEATLSEAADALKAALAAIDGTKEISDSFEEGKTEYLFDVTPEGLAVGLTPAKLGEQLRGTFFGLEAQRLQRGRNEVIVYVRYPKAEREDLSTLSRARIRLDDGREVPLSSVAKITEQTGYSTITTVDGRMIVSVTADVDYSITTPNDVVAKMTDELLPDLQARYTGLHYSFEGETREQREDLSSLGRNMTIALLLIYVLLGAQLRSYVQPLIIMSAIPFGVIGAVWGHFLLGYDLSFISLFGIVALSGVVVNDSVVLMDYFNMQKKAGLPTYESALSAVQRRFRPILLTTLTTSLGLLPMLMETSMQARFLIPMVISLAVGILFATTIILLLVPNLIMVIDDIKIAARKARQWGHRRIKAGLNT